MIRIVRRSYWWRGMLAVAVSAPLLAAGLVFWRAAHAKEEAARLPAVEALRLED